MTNQQKKWADHVINGKHHTEAYLLAFPKSSKKTAANQVGKYKANVGIMDYVRDGLSRIAQKVEAKVVEKLSDITVGNVLTSSKKREILNLIASGELEYEKMVMVKDAESGKMVWRKILIKPDLHERMKAMDIDNRMTGETFRAKPHELSGEQDKAELDDLFKNTTFVFKAKD